MEMKASLPVVCVNRCIKSTVGQFGCQSVDGLKLGLELQVLTF